MKVKDSAEILVRRAIQRRLEYAESLRGVELGSLIQIDDSGYEAICGLSQNNQELALEVVKRVLPKPKQLAKRRPYVITKEHVNALGVTYEQLREYRDSPLRGATVELKL